MRSIHLLRTIALLPFLAPDLNAGVLYSQSSDYPNSFGALTSQNQASGANYQTFDNFSLASSATIQSITWQGIYWDPRGLQFNPPTAFNPPTPNTNSFQIGFFANQNNLPGNLIGSAITLTSLQSATVGKATFGPDNFGNFDPVNVVNFSANLSTPFTATGGTTYWLSIVSFANLYPPAFLWTSGSGGDGKSAQLNYGAPNAVYRTGDRAFSLSDSVQTTLLGGSGPTNPPTGLLEDVPIPEPGSLALAATGLLSVCAGRLAARRRASENRAK